MVLKGLDMSIGLIISIAIGLALILAVILMVQSNTSEIGGIFFKQTSFNVFGG